MPRFLVGTLNDVGGPPAPCLPAPIEIDEQELLLYSLVLEYRSI